MFLRSGCMKGKVFMVRTRSAVWKTRGFGSYDVVQTVNQDSLQDEGCVRLWVIPRFSLYGL